MGATLLRIEVGMSAYVHPSGQLVENISTSSALFGLGSGSGN